MLPGLGSFREERIPGICRESFYCKISAADVRRHEQDIYRTEAGRGSGKDLFCFIMPCTAKKYECDVEEVNDADAGKDVDLVLTTREMGRLINADRIKTDELEEAPFDDFFGEATGAASYSVRPAVLWRRRCVRLTSC